MITDSLLNEYSRLFVSRRDDYAIQQPSGRYLRAGCPLTTMALRNHLDGIESLGTYVIDERGRCRLPSSMPMLTMVWMCCLACKGRWLSMVFPRIWNARAVG